MTTEEIQDKLTPGKPATAFGAGNDEFYPSGKADAVIFRIPKQQLVHIDGELVKVGTKKIGDKFVSPQDVERAKIERSAMCYLSPSSKEDRTTPFGFTNKIGIIAHLGGLLDILTKRSESLSKERETFQFGMWCASTQIGKDMMHPEIRAFLKVIPVEDGIYCVLYDPENEIP